MRNYVLVACGDKKASTCKPMTDLNPDKWTDCRERTLSVIKRP